MLTRPQLLLTLARLFEVEADPRSEVAVQHLDHYPRPALAIIMACGEERREALEQARQLGATKRDRDAVERWFTAASYFEEGQSHG